MAEARRFRDARDWSQFHTPKNLAAAIAIEAAELQAKVNERRSALEAARADARWTSRDRSDKESLASRNIVSQSAADQARATAENRSSMVSVAEAQLEVAMRNLADAQVLGS